MTELIPFTSPTGTTIRATNINGEPWIIAADICQDLTLRDTSSALKMVDDEDKRTLSRSEGPHFPQGMDPRIHTVTVVNESGLFSLIFQSNKSEARRFKRWVTNEVLPQIRKTGVFLDPSKITRKELALMVFEAEERLEIAEAARTNAEEYARELEPSANAWEALADAKGDYSVADVAKILDRDPAITMGRDRLFQYMASLGWVYRDRFTQRWSAYQTQVDAKRLVMKIGAAYERTNGEMHLPEPTIRITSKGLRDLHKKLGGSPEGPAFLGAAAVG